MIHSKIVPRMSNTGPTKRKIPDTAYAPSAPPQPMSTMEKVMVEMTKPTKPIGVGLAKRLRASPV